MLLFVFVPCGSWHARHSQCGAELGKGPLVQVQLFCWARQLAKQLARPVTLGQLAMSLWQWAASSVGHLLPESRDVEILSASADLSAKAGLLPAAPQRAPCCRLCECVNDTVDPQVRRHELPAASFTWQFVDATYNCPASKSQCLAGVKADRWVRLGGCWAAAARLLLERLTHVKSSQQLQTCDVTPVISDFQPMIMSKPSKVKQPEQPAQGPMSHC